MRKENGTDQEHNKGTDRKRKMGTLVFRAVVLLLLLAVIALLIHRKTSDGPEPQKQEDDASRQRELNAQLGILPDMSPDEIQDALNRQVEKGMLNVSMNPLPVFADGKSPGNVRIQNIAGNHYSIKVTYVRSDTGEAVLTTKYIDPGYYVDNMKLDKKLPKGQYLCVANVDAFDPVTLDPVGSTGMEVLITVSR